jgi:hypothetical protein
MKRVRIDLQRSDAATTESYHQLAALIGLYATLGIQVPLPRIVRAIGPLDSIDLRVIDGPRGTHSRSRALPSVPVMLERFGPRGAILLDDTDRENEQETLRR